MCTGVAGGRILEASAGVADVSNVQLIWVRCLTHSIFKRRCNTNIAGWASTSKRCALALRSVLATYWCVNYGLCRQAATRVPESLFWADYAARLNTNGKGPFLSRHLAHAGHSFTDAVAAVAVTGRHFTWMLSCEDALIEVARHVQACTAAASR